jgi:hypothetical protein
MRGVFSRKLLAVFALVVILLAPSALADSGDSSLWAQFVAWADSQISVPNGATTADDISFEEWLVLMGRINIPNG